MRFIFLLLGICLCLSVNAQIGVVWENEIEVSDGSDNGKLRPRVCLNSQDLPVVVYGKTDAVSVSVFDGTSFGTTQNVLPAGMTNYVAGWTGPDIASNGDTIVVVFKEMPLETGNVYSVRSIDGGLTFSDTIRVDNHDSGVAWLPSIDMDANGNVLVSYMIHDANWTNPRYVLARSTDAGLTYTSEINVVSSIPGEACDCCPSGVVKDGSREVLLFRNNEVNVRDIYAVVSNDNGATFPFEENIDLNNWWIAGCPSTGPDGVIVGDELLTVFASSASGASRAYISSADLSTGLSHNATDYDIASTFAQNYPRIDNTGDTIAVAWKSYFGPQVEVYVGIATNGGYDQVYQNGIIANQYSSGVQTNPDVALSQSNIHLMYQDDDRNAVYYRRGVIDDVTGLNDSELSDLMISPNPAVDNIELTHSVERAIVLNIGGEKLIEGMNTSSIDISSLESGVYILVTYNAGRIKKGKLIKR